MNKVVSVLLIMVFATAMFPRFAVAQQTTVTLPEDTPIKLRLTQTVSSGTAKINDRVDFEVVEDVKVGDTIVIQHGAPAIATVTDAHAKRNLGRSGKLNINIDYVRLANGDKAALRTVKNSTGGSHTGAMTGAIVATSILFFPAAPLFLFMKGKNITIPKGTEITAYIAADTVYTPQVATAPPVAAQPVTTGISTVIVNSTPTGAEIFVDDKFVGATPSTLKLAPGEHAVRIEKTGFKAWNRMLTVNAGGSVTIDATLDHP